MPAIIEPECPNCKTPNVLTFYDDGSVKVRRCRCNTFTSEPWKKGHAFLKQHWWTLRVLWFADKLEDCLTEFSGPVRVDSKCLCNACAERLEDLAGAVDAAQKMGNNIPALGLP